MSAPELLYGHRVPGTFGSRALPLLADALGEVLLKDVQIHYCLFELPMADVLPRLPAGLHPSVPAVIGHTVWRCPASPFGAFSLAYLGLACRTGIKPRHLVHGAFCDNPEAAGWLQGRYGLACQPARIRSLETYDRAFSQVVCQRQVVLELATDRTQPLVAGSTVKYSPILNAARVGDELTLVQMEVGFDFKRVIRGSPRALFHASDALGDSALSPHYPVSGTWAEVDVTLLPPRFRLEVEVSAEQGGAKKL